MNASGSAPVRGGGQPTVLAIVTSTQALGVAVHGPGRDASVRIGAGRRHVEELVPAVEYLLRAVECTMADLAAVAVDVGPGLFTGLRVGMATAGALAAAAGIPTVGVSSLDILAADSAAEGPVAAVIDARRGEVFWSWYSAATAARPEGADGPHVDGPEDAVRALEACASSAMTAGSVPRPPLVIGDGAARYREQFAAVGRVVAADPDPAVLARLAIGRLATGGAGVAVSAGQLRPLYLREADAVANFPTLKPVSVGPSESRATGDGAHD